MLDITYEHIRQSNLIENIDSTLEDDRSMHVWETLRPEEILSHSVICQTQWGITRAQNLPMRAIGAYRDYGGFNVEVGSRECPHFLQVPSLMDEWLISYRNGAENPLQAHIEFEKIHPFLDGNGRTGRMLLWWHEIKNGNEPTLFLASEKWEKYYPLFKD